MKNNPPFEVVAEYVERKRAKGTWRTKKQRRWEGRIVRTGVCPCPDCGHRGEPMIVCDAEWNDCHCCDEVCS